jgi:hypothetical protein
MHVKTRQRSARTGQIPSHTIGRYWYFRASELDKWLTGELDQLKATQDMLRHASSSLTLELYAQRIPEDRPTAQTGILRAVAAGSAPSVPKRSLINS